MCPAPRTPSQPVPADTEPALYPLTFTPVFKDYPWGGRNLETIFQRTIPEGIVAESWDIAAHPNGSSPVSNGAFAGMTLPQLMDELGEELVGSNSEQATAMGRFPLLIKLLDANRWLSIQVHPEDGYALANENEFGKTEMSEGSELHQSVLRAVLFAMMELVTDIDSTQVLAHLTLNVPDYYSNQVQRELVVELADYLAKKLETLRPDEASAARVLREMVKNQRLG